MNLIEMNSICKRYHNIGFETQVLEDVTLHIKEGDYVSIIGPSGAGKSTLMAIMGCLAQPT
ncbi:MAG TPA: ATP-binding cassette domain-containing protein, partial [Nitrospinaceae bacterium]|nr:ATP-binding cassette domain-containing protein [Nitrospinaceae bacterium]